jgi:methionine synthase I (cobalamin-dependent)
MFRGMASHVDRILRAPSMYKAIEQKLTTGEISVLDGGTGTEIERRGAPMSDESWSAPATLTHPDIVREVHAYYIRAGADVVIANTFGSSPFVLDHYGKLDELPRIDDAAVRLARQAREDAADRPVAVAGSFSVMRPVTKGTDRTPAGGWSEHEARPLLHPQGCCGVSGAHAGCGCHRVSV